MCCRRRFQLLGSLFVLGVEALDVTAFWDAGFDGLVQGLLGGSWVVISGVISKVAVAITHISYWGTYNHTRITTHEPPSRACSQGRGVH